MQKLTADLDKAYKALADYDKFMHLFSVDDGTRILAELHSTIGQILYRLKLHTIKEVGHPQNEALTEPLRPESAGLVKVKPCAEECNNKTYIGYYIGDIALGSSVQIQDDKIVCEWSGYNPAIYVPALGRVVYGCESWWGNIKSVEELRDITDEDISSVWYVQALKELAEKEASK